MAEKIDNPASALSKIFNTYTKMNVEKTKLKNEMIQARLKRQGGLEDFAFKEAFKGEQAQAKLGEQRSYDESKAERTRATGMEDFYAKEDYKRANPTPGKEKVPPQENYAKIVKIVNSLRLKEKMNTLTGEEAEYLHILENKFYGKDKEAGAWDSYGENQPEDKGQDLGQAETNDEYEVDAIYEDEDGRKAKYLGGGEWEIQ